VLDFLKPSVRILKTFVIIEENRMPPGKDKDAAPSAEINRLKAMVVKDPRSKMFIPLAEEYIKAGMPDEAVAVLSLGLKANPFYTSARVMLGKAYIEQGLAEKACEEFERVVSVVPDNLFAHRKLGEIYLERGMKAEALKSFKMVAVLNPKDDEARRFIEEMEKGESSATEALSEAAIADAASHIEPESAAKADIASPPWEEAPAVFDVAETEVQEPVESMETVEAEEDFSVPAWTVDSVEVEEPERHEQYEWAEGPEQPVQPAEPEQTEWSLHPEQHEEQAEQPGQLEQHEQIEEPENIEEPQPAMMEMPVPEMETLGSLEQAASAEELYGEPVEEDEEGPASAGAYSLDESAGMGFDEIVSAYGDAALEYEAAQEEPGGVYEIDEEVSPAGIEGLGLEAGLIPVEDDAAPAVEQAVEVYEPGQESEPPVASDVFETRTLAELYVAQGFYDRAIGIYKNLLLDDPGNLELRAKLDELYGRPGGITSGFAPVPETAFMGGNGEAVARLEHFLEAIRRKAGR
jgi:tetratricopeptide (TPR) repeat protein